MFSTLYSGYFAMLGIQTLLFRVHTSYTPISWETHYLALIGDKWPEMEPPFLGSITENFWGWIFSGTRVFWGLLAVYNLQERPKKHNKMSALLNKLSVYWNCIAESLSFNVANEGLLLKSPSFANYIRKISSLVIKKVN